MTYPFDKPGPASDRATELWSFAVRCYALEQAHLLSLQNSARLHINDALVAAYAIAGSLGIDAGRWHDVRAGRPRQVLLRVRGYRQTMTRSDPGRPRVLDWELALERWDLSRLATCLVSEGVDRGGHEFIVALLSEQCDLSAEEVEPLLLRLQRSAEQG